MNVIIISLDSAYECVHTALIDTRNTHPEAKASCRGVKAQRARCAESPSESKRGRSVQEQQRQMVAFLRVVRRFVRQMVVTLHTILDAAGAFPTRHK